MIKKQKQKYGKFLGAFPSSSIYAYSTLQAQLEGNIKGFGFCQPCDNKNQNLLICFIILKLYSTKMSRKVSQKRPWHEKEDQILKKLYESLRVNKWSLIAEQLEHEYGFSGRTGKQCRERYNNHLDPNLNREDWSFEQQKKLFELHDQLGNKWAIISHRLGVGRTDNSVKNHFFSKLRKSFRKLNKIIQQRYKKEIRQIQTKVLYKILQASQEKFKLEPMCDIQTSQNSCKLKNKILEFSYWAQDQTTNHNEEQIKDLILQIINFNKNYKRKPKKFRRTSTHNYQTLEVPRSKLTVKRYNSNESFSNSSNSCFESKSNLSSQESWEDEIDRGSQQKAQQRNAIKPAVLRSKSQPEFHQGMIEQQQQGIQNNNQLTEQKKNTMMSGEQMLDQLGLLEELDAAIHPSLMKKQTSHFSGMSSENQDDELKFFEDSEIQMRILFVPLPQSLKKQSYEDRLFRQ